MSRQTTKPVFTEPWEAKAFALTVHLHDRGLFTWEEWTQALGAERARRPDEDYYRAWTRTLEVLLGEIGVAEAAVLEKLAAAWQEAARTTPHGSPIELTNIVERLALSERAVSSSERN